MHRQRRSSTRKAAAALALARANCRFNSKLNDAPLMTAVAPTPALAPARVAWRFRQVTCLRWEAARTVLDLRFQSMHGTRMASFPITPVCA